MQHEAGACLEDILQAIARANAFVGDMELDEFVDCEKTHWAVFSQFVIIGEATRRISIEFREAHSEVEWYRMLGMRNRLVHAYDQADWLIVWKTLKNDIPVLSQAVQHALKHLRNDSST